MPFDTFGSRPGFRPDPFGRVLAEPGPDPKIENFRNPLQLRDSVGMEGMNSRRDVAKVENLLGRAGPLDLAKTDGVTGFFGARTDEAVKKFQKDRGLKVDGLVNPNGPTLRTLIAGAGLPAGSPGIVEKQEDPLPPFSERPTSDPRQDAIKRFARRLIEAQKAGVDLGVRRLAAAGTDAGDDEPGGGLKPPAEPAPPAKKPAPGPNNGPKNGPKTDEDRTKEILGKVQELVDALKDNPDPQAGDIDTVGSEEPPPRQLKDPSPLPEKPEPRDALKPPKENPKERKTLSDEERKEIQRSLSDNLIGIIQLLVKQLRRMPMFMIPPEDVLRDPKLPKDPA